MKSKQDQTFDMATLLPFYAVLFFRAERIAPEVRKTMTEARQLLGTFSSILFMFTLVNSGSVQSQPTLTIPVQ